MSDESPIFAPTLETERLILRGWNVDDFSDLATFLADDEANRFRGGAVDRNAAWAYLEGLAGQWALRGYGTFAVEDKETGELVGWAGLWHPARLEEPELCWSVFPAHTGQGYAHEAAGAALVWWTQIEDQPAPFSMTHPDNIASQRVAEKLGAVRGEDFVFDGRPSFFYRHQIGTREEMVH
ncbi:MAG: GNAT family N-acetyltransferase [Hyphomicrobiales bacterium]|jgi:RimJ/RimL family protein N-acetyltransferase